ncbi:hypothetical protein CYMTET_8848, partial [Cymbomonas tetramitiformis]
MSTLKLCKTLWGVPEAADVSRWDDLFARIKSEGFDAIETGPVIWRAAPEKFASSLKGAGLKLIAQIHTTGCNTLPDGTYVYNSSTKVEDHISSFDALVKEASAFSPVMINSHSGHDSWSVAQATEYLKAALRIEEAAGILVTHETHRRRILWNPYNARDILTQPGMEVGVRPIMAAFSGTPATRM